MLVLDFAPPCVVAFLLYFLRASLLFPGQIYAAGPPIHKFTPQLYLFSYLSLTVCSLFQQTYSNTEYLCLILFCIFLFPSHIAHNIPSCLVMFIKLIFKTGLSVPISLPLMEPGIICNPVCCLFFIYINACASQMSCCLPVSSLPSGRNLLLCLAVHLEEGQPTEPT